MVMEGKLYSFLLKKSLEQGNVNRLTTIPSANILSCTCPQELSGRSVLFVPCV